MTDLFGCPTPPAAADDRKPPTDGDRLRMFVSLATEHAELAKAVETTNRSTMREPETADERNDHTRRQLRAASARKFILDNNDNTHLRKVFASADACISGTAPRMAGYIQGLREELTRLRTDAPIEYLLEGGDPIDDLDIINDLVYGRLLHGDYAKWWRSEQRKRTGWEVGSLMFWLSDAEGLIGVARDMVVEGVTRGYLVLNPVEQSRD